MPIEVFLPVFMTGATWFVFLTKIICTVYVVLKMYLSFQGAPNVYNVQYVIQNVHSYVLNMVTIIIHISDYYFLD